MSRSRSRAARWVRRLLGVVAVAGVLVAVAAGIAVLRDHLVGDEAVLIVDAASADASRDTLPVDAAAVERDSPYGLRIGDIGVDGEIREVGVDDDGFLEVPDETEIGWYKYGSAPGLPGATVLAAHVSWNRSPGPFLRLGDLEPGALVDVTLQDGSIRTYEVIERVMYPKDELPTERIWRTTGDETLVLITCGGDYNPNIRRYQHNIVVYAVPVAVTPAPPGGLGPDAAR